MSLHERVRHALNSLCEGNGVIECEDRDFEIWLDSLPLFVRTYESPPAVTVYQGVAPGLRQSLDLSKLLNRRNATHCVFRALWEDDCVLLRADIPAEPFSPGHLQHIIESFKIEADALAQELADWSR